MDFFNIVERNKRQELEIFPDFQTGEVTDLLGRGKSFYAIWDEEKGLWSTNENDVQRIVDAEIWKKVEEIKNTRGYEGYLNVKTMKSDSSGMWNRFTQYMKRFPDSHVQLDEKLTFANTQVKKKDHVSKRLPYALEPGDYSAWDKLVGKLYEPGEREKIEWAIGSIVSGDSKTIQKFCVFYGEAGSGKSTIINIIQKLFDGYYVTFDAKSLGSSSNQFATEAFRSNPLVAIQHDGDLSKIEDNTRINSIVSHEMMTIKEKFKPEYMSRANCFIFMGTNRPVRITDAKSGIIRRLIDINPSGQKFSSREYETLVTQIDFELGAIANHCLEVYRLLGKNYYKNYIPQEMIMKTDVFYNFVSASSDVFVDQGEGVSLKQAYSMYKEYCDDALVEFKLPMYKFREELRNYFEKFEQLARIDGKLVRSWYSGFKKEKLEPPVLMREEKPLPLVLDCNKSLLDDILMNCPAQYGVDDGKGNEKPEMAWSEVTTKLRDIDTRKTHYVQPQVYDKNFIVVDFDLKNEKGEKDMLLNAEAASKWPPTYTEFSKGGAGIHKHYIYDGDISKVNPMYSEGIEIKTFRGRAALRRRVSWCNEIDIAHLGIGALPLKEEKMIDTTVLKDEMHLRNLIKKCLRKGNHGATRPEIDLIAKALEDAQKSGMVYDVSDLEHDILVFAMGSTHQSEYCIKRVNEMRFASEKELAEEITKDDGEAPMVFFDIEIYPPGIDADGEENEGLFLVCWKIAGEGNKVVSMVNPKPYEIEELLKYRLIGFNNRSYDNHILMARLKGYNNARLYNLSKRIISEKARDALFPEAYDISYTDVFDFASKKQNLKAWEVELGISHIEMGLPWDQPAPKRTWDKIIEYCTNDVLATEAVFNARQEDWKARQILADLAGGKVNDTTNSLTLRIVFGKERNPTLVYTDLATGEQTEGR